MKIAYLINQYPKVSHSFIRREIIALEKLGVHVARYSIREIPADELVDPEDVKESEKTFALLGAGILRLLAATMEVVTTSPFAFFLDLAKATALGRKSRRGIIRHWAYLAEACLLVKKLKEEGIKHVHVHFGTNAATVAFLCKFLGGLDYSITIHGPEEFDDPVGLSLEEKIKKSRFVVAVSNFGRSQLMRHSPHTEWHKIRVIHCTVDQNFLNKGVAPFPHEPRLVCVGRLSEQKGQLLLLKALYQLHVEGVDLEMIFAGDGEMRPVIEECIMKYQLKEKAKITGWISGAEVKDLILSSRALILPSFAEGLPVVIMEAFALRRPVISTFVAGIPELVEHEKNGWLIPAGSVDSLAAAIKKVLETPPETLQAMGEAGAASVAANHNDRIEARHLVELFHTCVSKSTDKG
jgi:glycosyltransferase involved in cell wall biosynthesis